MISVCMATYNGEKYLKEQIESILCQLSLEDELIISDDGSTDSTLDIIEKINDSRICLLKNNGHCYTSNFENALRNARGDYIFLSDQDDIWIDKKVEITLNYLKKYEFVYSDARIVDADGEVISQSRNNHFQIKNGFVRNLFKTYYLGCCMAFTRDVLEAVLPFPSNRELCFHDAWIAMLSELCFRTCICKERLIDYRRHGENVSSGSVGVKSSISRMLQIRIYLLTQTLKRRKQRKLRLRLHG